VKRLSEASRDLATRGGKATSRLVEE
jgi:hypothetical protein